MPFMRSARRLLLLVALAALATLGTASAAPARALPDVIPLPDGFRPEGIDITGNGSFYVGSIPTGAVYRGDVRSGQGSVLVQPQPGRAAIGIEVDRRGRLFVAGGPTGQAYVYDAHTGAPLASYQLTDTADTFVNDVVVTRTGAWFTDSRNQVLYRVPIGRHGQLGDPDDVTTLPLTGDLRYVPGETNLNGIDAANGGRVLVAVQSNTGLLFTVNPGTGATRQVDLGGETVPNGDGLLLRGRTLFVVQNRLNLVATVRLGRHLTTGRVVARIGDPDFDVPTTIASFRGRLYVVNARFSTPPTPDTPYWVAKVDGR
jgi:sugar lactone lactonase YvrE